jgi:hypothetical protein
VDFCAISNAKIPIIRPARTFGSMAVCREKIALQTIFRDFMREAQQTARACPKTI